MIAPIAAVTYHGSAQQPAPAVSYAGAGSGNLITTGDYTVDYSDNVNAGTARAVITARAESNNFTGSAGAAFTIEPKDLSGFPVVAIPEQRHTGQPITPVPAVTDPDRPAALIPGLDFTAAYEDNVDVGTARVTITGRGNYRGTIADIPFRIVAVSSTFDLALDKTRWTWGEEGPAAIAVTYTTGGSASTLTIGTDYALTIQGQRYTDAAQVLAALAALAPGRTYTVAAEGMAGTGYAGLSDTVEVTVDKIQPTLSVSASPATLSGGGRVTLTLTGSGLPAGTDLAALLSLRTQNGTALDLTALTWSEQGGALTAAFTAANENETYTFTLAFGGSDTHAAASDTATVVTARTGGGGGITPAPDPDPAPEQPPVADPDDTGVSDWLETGAHMAYLTGYPDGAFGPDRNMTRAEVAQMFCNLLLDKEVTATVTFADVDGGAWYAEAVHTLATLGMIEGVGDGRFEPERTITRAEFTAIAMRFARRAQEGENIFSDVDEGDWFYDYVVGSIAYGWIEGYPDGTFRPDATITRAEVAAIVNRMLGRAADVDYLSGHAGQLREFTDLASTHWAWEEIMEAVNAHDYTKDSGREEWTGLS